MSSRWHGRRKWISPILSLVVGFSLPACNEADGPSTDATLVVTTTTTGLDIDPDGYRIAVDGADRGTIPANDTLLIRLDPGSRTIALTGLTPNCTVSGSGSQTTTIVVADTVEVSFSVTCVKNEGTLRITAPTTGPLPNVRYNIGLCDDWYCYYGAGFLGNLAPNDTLVVQLPASTSGILDVSNVPPNCVARNPSIQITVVFGDTLDVAFLVSCSP